MVGSIRPDGLAALAAAPAAANGPDLVEARLDLAVSETNPGTLPDLRPYFEPCRRLEQAGRPVLATMRLTADGGRWTVDAERRPWFEQAIAVASFVDVEVDSVIAGDVIGLAHQRGRRVVASYHDFAGTPDADKLDAVVDRGRALGADIVKIATVVDGTGDHDRLIDLLRRQRAAFSGKWPGLAIIGMGSFGVPLRSYLPAVGSRLTYGYLDRTVAPGQIPAGELVDRLLRDSPIYAEHRLGGTR